MSSELPAANGIIARIGRVGQACANPAPGKAGTVSAAPANWRNWRRVVMAGRFPGFLAGSAGRCCRHALEHQLLQAGGRSARCRCCLWNRSRCGGRRRSGPGTLISPTMSSVLRSTNDDVLAAADIEELLLRIGRQARGRARTASSVWTSCFTNLPSLVNICTRRFSRSATYTMPSLATRIACTMLKSGGPSPSGKLFGPTIAQCRRRRAACRRRPTSA